MQDSNNVHPERNCHSEVFWNHVHTLLVASRNHCFGYFDNSPATYVMLLRNFDGHFAYLIQGLNGL